MSTNKDGGPAFPVLCQWVDGVPVQGVQTDNAQGWAMGMSLRDYFAAKALHGLIAAWPAKHYKSVSEEAYKYADAMLKAREASRD